MPDGRPHDFEVGQVLQFPKGLPKPHQARDWHRSLENAATTADLIDVIHHRLPAGKFDKLYSDAACEMPPDLPRDAGYKDRMAFLGRRDKVEERLAHNELVREKRADWWLKNNHKLYVLITSTMTQTAPQIAEVCRDKYLVETGFYDGYATLQYVEVYLTDLARRHPQYAVYENAVEMIVKKRLPQGCGEPEFSSVARRFVFDLNPFQRAPLSGEILGEFIITKIMPEYTEAADRLVERMREKGELDDHEKVGTATGGRPSGCSPTSRRR